MKDPNKTFIGGLVIGFIIGGLVMNVLMANWIIAVFG